MLRDERWYALPMNKAMHVIVYTMAFCFCAVTVVGQSQPSKPRQMPENQRASSLPSDEEIGELLVKAKQYVDSYQATVSRTKRSLDKTATPGFYLEMTKLASQATKRIIDIRKNGSSAYALVGLIAILDDMTLNASRASAAVTIVAMQERQSDPNNHGMVDFQALAQAGQNCYDISDLILQATLRYIAVEESALRTLVNKGKQ